MSQDAALVEKMIERRVKEDLEFVVLRYGVCGTNSVADWLELLRGLDCGGRAARARALTPSSASTPRCCCPLFTIASKEMML